MAKIAINGFGRIGRAFYKMALEKSELEVVAINDLGDPENLAYLLKYDSAYGRVKKEVKYLEEDGKKYLQVGDKKTLFIQEKDATKLPWGELGVDIVVESTGVFESYEKARVHIQAGAKRVVLSAPAKDEDGPDAKTILLGVNDEMMKDAVLTSNGSCTTNSISVVMKVLVEKIGIKKAFLNTIHAYTGTQNLVDGPVKGKDYRRGRAGAANLVPSSTGAAIAVARVVEQIRGKFDGIAIRTPVITASLSAVTFVSERPTSAEEINKILEDAANDPKYSEILKVTHDQIVSSDMIAEEHTSVVDASLTKVVDGDLCAIYCWYDNEYGYTVTLMEHVSRLAKSM